jgi:hypothetical protein
MNARLATLLSLAANLMLALALGVLWQRRLAPPKTPPPAPTPLVAGTRPPPASTSPPQPAPSASRAFHWSQVESEDYRQYIANLRTLGCPERLIRDLLVSDLDALYETRRRTLKPVRLPPWDGADRQAAASAEFQAALRALEEEHRAVTTELLGFPWERQALESFHREELAGALLGFLPAEQAIQLLSIPEAYENRARAIRERANHILLAEDRTELAGLADELEARLAATLAPAQLEELMLRVHAILALAKDGHFEAADLTGAQAREIARLSRQSVDLIREEFLEVREVTEEQRKQREADYEAALAKSLGPGKAADVTRARDDRFRETLDFAREQNLPRQTAVQAYEIRSVAETEAEQVRTDRQLTPETRQARLQELQAATAAALTRVIGQAHMPKYLGTPGEWINGLGSLEAPQPEGRD